MRVSPDVEAATQPPEQAAAVRAERGIALVSAAMRSVVVLQILVALPSGIGLAATPWLYVVLAGAVLAVSAALIAGCLRSSSVRAGRWQPIDIPLGFAAYPVMTLVLPAEHTVGTWEAWAGGYAVNVAAIGSTYLPARAAVAVGLGLGAWSFGWTASAAGSWSTAFNNAATVPGYAIVVALLVAYIRGLAADADRSKEEAVTATRALELHRYQLTVHDATSILRLLSDERTPAEVLPALRLQAERESRRLRTYLGQTPPPRGDERESTIGTMIDSAAEGFDDLPLHLVIDLGAEVVLDPEVWAATDRAVATVLHNTRLYAGARQVVVHADSDGRSWEVSVTDDGAGFDQQAQPLGFGLSTQVQQALREVGVDSSIWSAPGQGTSVVMRGTVGVPYP